MDYYLNRQNATNRLFDEYKKYSKIIIAYDFDNTVFDYHGDGHSYEDVMSLIRDFKEHARFIVFSSSKEERYSFIEDYLNLNTLPFDSINGDLVGDFGRKVYYNILLDDRAGLDSAYNTLKELLKLIKQTKTKDEK